MIQEALAQRVLEAALETGGDFSELFMEDTETHSISMLNGTVENAAYRRRTGAGVRVLKGEQSAYAYTADTSEAALLEAARGAAAVLEGKKGKYKLGIIPCSAGVFPRLIERDADSAK